MVKFIVSVLQAQGGDRGRRAALGLVVENPEWKKAGGTMSGHLLLHYHLPCREAWSLEGKRKDSEDWRRGIVKQLTTRKVCSTGRSLKLGIIAYELTKLFQMCNCFQMVKTIWQE